MSPPLGGISLIAKAALLKSASNHLRRGVWVGVPLPPLVLIINNQKSMKQEEKTERVVVAKKPYKKPVDDHNISEIWYQ